VLLADQQVSVQCHHDVGDVGAHFERLTEIGQHHNLEVLRELGAVDRGAEAVTHVFEATIHGIEHVDDAVDAVESSVCTHVLVEVLF
jgi:hypothetical protein